jgi:hypothetical protein
MAFAKWSGITHIPLAPRVNLISRDGTTDLASLWPISYFNPLSRQTVCGPPFNLMLFPNDGYWFYFLMPRDTI